MSEEEKASLIGNPRSKVVLLQKDEREVAEIFLRIPWEYGINGAVGKQYHAAKDYVKWAGMKKKMFVPLLMDMGSIWVKAHAEEATVQ